MPLWDLNLIIKVLEGSIPHKSVRLCGEHRFPDFYVVFWEWRDFGGGKARYHLGFTLTGCSSVIEAIEWEEEKAGGRQSATLLPVRDSSGDCESLILLHGEYPEGEEIFPEGDFGWVMYKCDSSD